MFFLPLVLSNLGYKETLKPHGFIKESESFHYENWSSMKHQIPWLFWSTLWFSVLKSPVTKTIYRHMVKFTGQEYGCFCVRSQASHLPSPVVIFPIWKQVLNNESLSSLPALQVWLYSGYQYSRPNNQHVVPLLRLDSRACLILLKVSCLQPREGQAHGSWPIIESVRKYWMPAMCQTLCSVCTAEKSRDA